MVRHLPVFLMLLVPPAGAQDQSNQAKINARVVTHIFATSVHFDEEGNCRADKNTTLRRWNVPGFPAAIPPFESCTNFQADNFSGEADFYAAITDAGGKVLERVEGVLKFSDNGLAAQAIDWKHLKIPAAGTYYFLLKVGGQEIKRLPLVFAKSSAGKKKR